LGQSPLPEVYLTSAIDTTAATTQSLALSEYRAQRGRKINQVTAFGLIRGESDNNSNSARLVHDEACGST
jgi:hypothetical protein